MTLSLLAFLATLPVAWLAMAMVLRWLRARQILDHPNERSSHSLPTPRGGGLALTPVILLAWLMLAQFEPALPGQSMIGTCAGGLLLLSWLDDRRGLSASSRFGLHALAVAAGLSAMPHFALLAHGLLPYWADRALAALAWLWFLNLYNFMDGIDGITGVETACIGFGLCLLDFAMPQAAVLIAASLAFLAWNWHPAKLFLGDSGSIPLGYLLGWLLLSLGSTSDWPAALILPSYYLADATLTLAKRAWRREKIWQAHRQHFYQQAVRGRLTHAGAARLILAGNSLLIAAAWWSRQQPLLALAAAIAVNVALLRLLALFGRGQRPEMMAGHHQGRQID